jgi:hypothetical protein
MVIVCHSAANVSYRASFLNFFLDVRPPHLDLFFISCTIFVSSEIRTCCVQRMLFLNSFSLTNLIAGALLVYDITDSESFVKVKNWVKELRKMVSNR